MKKFNRRRFLGMAAGAAGALSGAACGTSVDLGSNAAGPSVEDLDRAAATPDRGSVRTGPACHHRLNPPAGERR